MGIWRSIDTLPKSWRDGRMVVVKRMFKGRLVVDGPARFGLPDAAAPMLQPVEPDPLDRMTTEQYASAERAVEAARQTKRWMQPDFIYAFPEPTHWWDASGRDASAAEEPSAAPIGEKP